MNGEKQKVRLTSWNKPPKLSAKRNLQLTCFIFHNTIAASRDKSSEGRGLISPPSWAVRKVFDNNLVF